MTNWWQIQWRMFSVVPLLGPGTRGPPALVVMYSVWGLTFEDLPGDVWRSQLDVVLLILMIYCHSPASILSSDTTWSAQINYTDTFPKHWKMEIISGLSKHEQLFTAQWAQVDSLRWTRITEIRYFLSGAVNICYHYFCTPFIYTATYQLSLLLFNFLKTDPTFDHITIL